MNTSYGDCTSKHDFLITVVSAVVEACKVFQHQKSTRVVYMRMKQDN